MDLFNKAYKYETAKIAKQGGFYPYFHELRSKQDVIVEMEGKEVIMIGSNNYLGLTSHPEVIKASVDATLKYGTGVSGSRFLNGTLDLHIELEKELADFVNKEDATIFSTGYQSNLGFISAIAGRNDIIFSDKENHASIYDGIKLSHAQMVRYNHNDMEDLEEKLKVADVNKGKLIVTDGVFSMGGDLCDLPNLVRLAKKYNARLMVDDAHGLGVMGKTGRGTAEHFGLENEVDIIMGTFSKSLGSSGGFIAGEKDVIDYIRHHSRPYIFNAAIPPANTASALAALRVLKREPERTAPDKQVVFRQQLAGADLNIPFPRQNTPGEYRIDLQNDGSGEIVYSKNIQYPGIGEWEKQNFDEQRIIFPFTALEYENTPAAFSASMWGRNYTWENSLFPCQIRSQETDLLAAPMVLLANGKELQKAVFSSSKMAAHRGEFQMQAENADFQVTGNSWVEYDGVVWNQLEITPKNDLKDVKLQFRMPAKLAKFLHGSGGGGWGNRTTAKLQDGERFLRYYPVLWVGMEDKGLCFFTETRKNWQSEKLKTFRFFKDYNQAIIEINLAGSLKVGEPFRFDFGLLASPVRPLPENYPLNTLGWSHMSPLHRPGKRPTSDVTYIAMSGNSGDLGSFFADQDNQDGHLRAAALSKELTRIKPFGGRPIPYTCAMYISGKYPEMAAFKDEWGMVPELAMDYDHTGHYIYGCCPSTGANDFFVYRYRKMLERFDLSGIYFDFGLISECNNKLHGCDQRYPILGMREFYRRIALVQLEAGIKEPILVIHNTDHVQLPALTFTTHLLNGEQVRQASSSTLHDKKDILDTYELEMFASELSTLPFGITNSVYIPADNLAARYGGDEEDEPYKFRQTKATLAAVLPHNTLPCLWRTHFGIYDKVIRFYDRFDVPKAKFYGYWEEPARLLKGQNVIISVYRHAGEAKILAVIGHIGKEHVDQDIDLVFDLPKLGLFGLKEASDLMTDPDADYAWLEQAMQNYQVPRVRAPLSLGEFGTKVIALENNVLKLHLPFHSFALVELSE